MSSLTHQTDHLAWQQRLHHEQNSTQRFTTALQNISEQTGSPAKDKQIKPYKYVHGANQKIGRGVPCRKDDPCLFMIDSSQTTASNPNSMRNMGIPLKVEPQELVLESDMIEKNEEDQNEENDGKLEMDDAIDKELKKYMKEEKENKLEKQSERSERRSNKSYKSSIKDKEIMNQLESRDKKNQETSSIASSRKYNKIDDDCRSISSKATSAAKLISELRQKVKNAEEKSNASYKNAENPMLKNLVEQHSNYMASRGGVPQSSHGGSKRSLRSSASCTSIATSQISRSSVASYVKSLKNELQRERDARKKAESLLKTIVTDRKLK